MEARAAQRFLMRNEQDESKVESWTRQVSGLDGAMRSKTKKSADKKKQSSSSAAAAEAANPLYEEASFEDEEYGNLYCAQNALY